MNATRIDQAGPSTAVAEEDQILCEHPHFFRHVARIRAYSDRMPVSSQQLAHGATAADLRQLATKARLGPAVSIVRSHVRNAPIREGPRFGGGWLECCTDRQRHSAH